MGIIVPNYTSMTPGNTVTIQNAYMSLRFETIVILCNPNGTYNVNTVARVFNNQTDIFTQDIRPVGLVLTKEQFNAPIHTIIYTYLKSLYPGSTDAI